MKRLLILIIFLPLVRGFSQVTDFQFAPITIREAREIEEKQRSKEIKVDHEISVSPDYFPGASDYDFAQPLIYLRLEKNFVNDLEVEYYYTEPDKIVRLIVYTWDTKGESKKLNYDSLPEYTEGAMEAYNKRYEELLTFIEERMGKPSEGIGKLEVKGSTAYGEWKERKAKWNTDKSVIELNMIYTNQNASVGQHTKLVPTLRIRMKVYWNLGS